MEYANVSVVIPCYRCTETIDRAVSSVLSQTLLPCEIILVNDGSPDNTLKKLYELKERVAILPVRVVSLDKNSGPSVARNSGWEAAIGRYIAFLDSDDSWHPKKIEIQYAFMERYPDFSITGHRGKNIRSAAECAIQERIASEHKVREIRKFRILCFNEFITRSVMIRRDMSQRFSPALRYCEDYLLWMHVICSGQRGAVIELPLAYAFKANSGDSGLSGNVWMMEKGELHAYRVIFKEYGVNGFLGAGIYGFSLLKFVRRYVFARCRNLAYSFRGK